VAVRVFAPEVDGVSEQVAVAAAPESESVQGALVSVPSDTVTVPPGVAAPLARVTLTPTEIADPATDGSGVCEVIAVVVFTLGAVTVTTGLAAIACKAPLVPSVLVDDVNVAGPTTESAVVLYVMVTVLPRLQLLPPPETWMLRPATAIDGLPGQVSADIAT